MPRRPPPAKPPPAPPRRPNAPALLVAATALVAAAVAAAVWWADRSAPAPPPRAELPASVAAVESASAMPAPPPLVVRAGAPRGGYVGRKRCAECHEKEHAAWSHDWHARALAHATPDSVEGRFGDVHFKGSSSEAWMLKEKGGYRVRTAGPRGEVASYAVDWVIGGKRMQDPVTVFPDGRWQVLPVYFHVTGKGEWVDYNESKQGPLSPDHPYYWSNFRRTVNRECLDCHATGVQVRYDRGARTWSTSMVNDSVACESCHGPGARHADTQDPDDIVQPAKASPEVALAVCAQCHGPRNPLFPLLDEAHRFAAGDRYEDYYEPHGLVTGNQRSGDFFADGRPKTSSFEVQALLQSRCHLKGNATCLSCHTAPHAARHGKDELKAGDEGADAVSCKGCHAGLFSDPGAHAHHKDPRAQSCIACHMPPVLTGVLDAFADHAIDVPVPENTVKHGIPNACNVCHDKKPPEEMAQAVAAWWPGSAARAERRRRLADAFDDATKDRSLGPLEAVIADAGEASTLRATAATLLAERFPERARAAITPLLASPEAIVRARAAEALGTARAKESADDLARLGADPSVFVREASALVLAQLPDPRAEAALRALTSAPSTEGMPRPHALLGLTLLRRKELQEATRELERAVELQPYYTEALVMLADLYAKQDRFELTRARIEEVLLFDPQNQGAKQRLAMLNSGR